MLHREEYLDMDQLQVTSPSKRMNGTAIGRLFLLLVLSFRMGVTAGQENKVHLLHSNPVYIDQQGVSTYAIDIDTLTRDTLQFDFTYWERWRDSKFYAGQDTVFITRNSREREFIRCRSSRKTVVFDVVSQLHPFQFDEAYRRANKSRVSIQIPVGHELASIIIALTDKAQRTPAWYAKNNDYFQRVNRYFAAYKAHPLIAYLNTHAEADVYLNFRENGAAYTYDSKHLRLGDPYRGFRARDQFGHLLPLVEDFASRSNFLAFYQGEIDFYNTLIKTEAEKADIYRMWQWLEKHFNSKYHSYKVIMSPLNAGWHSTRVYEDQDFKETIMFVSAPGSGGDEPLVYEGNIRRTVFTEIDHNYVNPVSDRYQREIEAALGSRLDRWNAGESYASPLLTFNEYMTWAVFGLYLYDNYGLKVHREIMPGPIRFMEGKRGFVQFKAFQDKLLELYLARKGEEIADLYPQMIRWMKSHTKGR
jgi:hypothetical protein